MRVQDILMNKESLKDDVWESIHILFCLIGNIDQHYWLLHKQHSDRNVYSCFINNLFITSIHFDRCVEILTDRYYTLGAGFAYTESPNECNEIDICHQNNDQHFEPIEMVWGGGGEKIVCSMESGSKFHFEKISRDNVRSSWANGQIPILYFV